MLWTMGFSHSSVGRSLRALVSCGVNPEAFFALGSLLSMLLGNLHRLPGSATSDGGMANTGIWMPGAGGRGDIVCSLHQSLPHLYTEDCSILGTMTSDELLSGGAMSASSSLKPLSGLTGQHQIECRGFAKYGLRRDLRLALRRFANSHSNCNLIISTIYCMWFVLGYFLAHHGSYQMLTTHAVEDGSRSVGMLFIAQHWTDGLNMACVLVGVSCVLSLRIV